ncbi:MAG: 16S rRNA (guanine(966)-N(2))-methyltransferase RsmD, partial [Bacteroidales bacterium]|nr:16S rRNA (guanine(966)-N(2))-methyltransferase RsmD [Bacteroidales bacterium]
MRIIAGKNKGRHIITPQNLPVRPTTDLGKESLFNILNNYFNFDRIVVCDLFAGTGNLSYEFASRGALSVVSVEQNHACAEFIKKNLNTLQYNNVTVVKGDVFHFLERSRQSFDIIFADPPYNLSNIEKIIELVFKNNLLKLNGWLVLEHSKEHN